MKSNFPLFLCVNFFLLSLVIARSAGGVANPKCKKGKFFHRSRQEYLSCHECKSEIQECFTCCQSEVETQGKVLSIKLYPPFMLRDANTVSYLFLPFR